MPSFRLEAADVRKCVRRINPEAREVPNHEADGGVISFLLGVEDRESLCRLNVYLRNGTVGCNRILGDDVREVFVRNVTTMEALAKLVQSPPRLTQIDKSLLLNGSDTVSKMELAEVGVCVLMGERTRLVEHLQSLEEKQPANNDDVSLESLEGMEFAFSLPEDVMQQVDQCLHDISKMGKHVNCVTTNGKGAVFLYGNGGVAYTPNIPRALYNKLKALRSNPKATRPNYVAVGTRERYFVSFMNGTFDWKGPKALGQSLKKSGIAPKSVAFGSNFDAYFIVYDDGSWEYHGRGIPKDLQEKLKEREERADLVCVTLGPNGEWFLRAQNGRMWWGGVGNDLDNLVQSLLTSDRYLNFLDFGEDGTYFVSYD